MPPTVGCNAPISVPIVGMSFDVFVEGVGVSRLTDTVQAHPYPLAPVPCEPHVPVCVVASADVFANGLPVARLGDKYEQGGEAHLVTTVTQSTVFANG